MRFIPFKNCGRRTLRLPIVVLSLLTLCPGEADRLLVAQMKFPDGWMSDSTLRDVFFVDHDFGWAVGEKGTILKSEDGGRSWQGITVPRDITWTSVFFLDETTGWIGGGYYRGSTGRSVGILIRTDDGGKNWRNVSKVGMPFIRRLAFSDSQNGWMNCDSSQIYPSGILVTQNSGQTWTTPPRLSQRPAILSDHIRDYEVVVTEDLLIHDRGRPKSANSSSAPAFASTASSGVRGQIKQSQGTPEAIAVTPQRNGILVGSDGLIMQGALGQKWRAAQDIPAAFRRFDWRDVAVRNQFQIVVGAPGGYALISRDGGQSWTSSATGECTPWNAAYFLTPERGWIVGDLGKILATKDGGKTWGCQRNPGLRLAALVVTEPNESLPSGAITAISGTAGGLVGCLRICDDSNNDAEANYRGRWSRRNEQVRQGINRLGGTLFQTANHYLDHESNAARRSTRSPTAARSSNQANSSAVDTASTETNHDRKLEMMVRWIRMWKPSVILTSSSIPSGSEGQTSRQHTLLSAVRQAGQASCFPQHVDCGLRPWEVEKVVFSTDELETASTVQNPRLLPTDQFASKLGRTLDEQIRFGKMLLNTEGSHQQHGGRPRPGQGGEIQWSVLYTTLPASLANSGILGGTRAASDPNCSRQDNQLQLKNMQMFRSLSKRRDNLQRLGRFDVRNEIDYRSWLDAITAATAGMDDFSHVFFLRDLSDTYSRLGRPHLSDLTEREILSRFPDSELGESALLRLIVRNGSSESVMSIDRAVNGQNRASQPGESDPDLDPKVGAEQFQSPTVDPAREAISGPAVTATEPSRPAPGNSGIQSAAHLAAQELSVSTLKPAMLRDAHNWSTVLQTRFPDLAARPRWNYVTTLIRSRTGSPLHLERLLDSSPESMTQDPTASNRLTRERLLRKNAEVGTVWSAPCPRIPVGSVVLDGKLNEDAWRGEAPFKFASDGKHLLLAGRFQQRRAVPPKLKRVRDEDVSGYDRCLIRIDVDRDDHSAIELIVDQRGCCNDAIWRDPWTRDSSYDPTWYVAVGSDSERQMWTVEAAIPLSELTPASNELLGVWTVQTEHVLAERETPNFELSSRHRLLRVGVVPTESSDTAKSNRIGVGEHVSELPPVSTTRK